MVPVAKRQFDGQFCPPEIVVLRVSSVKRVV